MPIFRHWSVGVLPDWEVKAELKLYSSANTTIDMNYVKMTDVEWRGELRCYDKTYDRICTSYDINLTPLQLFELVNFFNVTRCCGASSQPIRT